MTPIPLPECISPLLANMVFRSGAMAYIPNHPSNGQSAGWLTGADVLTAILVAVVLISIIVGMFYDLSLLTNGRQESLSGLFAKWRKVPENGDGGSEFNLGVSYANGEGVPKDAEESVKWYRKAAERGYAIAQYNLGLSCYLGEGVPQDLAEALKWFHEAAGQGLPEACHSLGVCHANGVGVAKSKVEAVKWYRIAAGQGYAKAQFNLGLCYSGGHGVPKDALTAYMWWNVSAAAGSSEAAKKRDALARRMTKEDVAEAQRRCRSLPGQEPEAVEQRSETLFNGSEFPSAQAA